MTGEIRDVVIVGAGDVGGAIARELSQFDLAVTLLEAQSDVGAGTSKANTALLHSGFDAVPGSLEARLVPRGHDLLLEYARRVGIPIERTGAVLVAWNAEQRDRLPQIVERSHQNGYDPIRELSPAELYHREPNLAPGAVAGLEVPDEHIIRPFTPPLAYVTEAVLAGCELRRDTALLGVRADSDPAMLLSTSRGTVRTRWLINAAGLHSDEIDGFLGHRRFTVKPRRGELIVFDKLTRSLVNRPILPVPTGRSKGVIVAPTVFGNVMVGPTADDIDAREDSSCTTEGLRTVRADARRIIPALGDAEITATYAGIRAATEQSDYQIHIEPDQRYICVGGIRSTGLTASMSIAEYVRDALDREGLSLRPKPVHVQLKMPGIGETCRRPYCDGDRVAADPDYGRIVCFCERVTRGEVIDALNSPVPPVDLDGLRRRTRALMGRCQGFYCGPTRRAIVAQMTGRDPGELLEGT